MGRYFEKQVLIFIAVTVWFQFGLKSDDELASIQIDVSKFKNNLNLVNRLQIIENQSSARFYLSSELTKRLEIREAHNNTKRIQKDNPDSIGFDVSVSEQKIGYNLGFEAILSFLSLEHSVEFMKAENSVILVKSRINDSISNKNTE